MAVVKEESRVKMINASAVVTSPPPGKMTIIGTMKSGHLYCYLHNTVWCEHIEATVRKFLDNKSIFDDFVGTYAINRIVVPLVPTENVFVDVVLEKHTDYSLKAFLCTVHGGEYLGFMNLGEGRLTLRQMVIDHLKPELLDGDFPTRGTRCRSIAHGYVQQVAMNTECRESETLRMAHLWTMRQYKKCLTCFKREGPDDKFDDDLIPD